MEKIHELKSGKVFKNYKELCNFLNQPYYTNSKDKKSQLERWNKYFNFEIRPNHSIKILEVYNYCELDTKVMYDKEQLKSNKPLRVGTVYDDYKQLCIVLNGTVYNHLNQRKRQMNNWKNYFDYEIRNDGSIIITKIIEIPDNFKKIHSSKNKKENKSNNKPRKNSVYLQHIENILLKLLRNSNDNTLCLFKTDLYIKLGMLNAKYNDPVLEEKLITELLPSDKYKNKLYLNNFKKQLLLRLHQIVLSSLKSMKKRRLIEYKERFLIYDENGNKELANEVQQLEIELAEEEALRILNMSKQYISLSGKHKTLYSLSREIFENNKNHNYIAYRKILWIKYTGENNDVSLDKIDIEKERKLLNAHIIECINNTLTSAKINHLNKIQNELNSISLGSIKPIQTKEYRDSHELYDDLYEDSNCILIKYLINYT